MADGTLRRSLGLPLLTLYGVGTTIGAGIYALIGKVAGEAGYLAPLAFVAAACLAGLSAFSFAEFASRFPKSAGEALYVAEGLRRPGLAVPVGILVIFAGCVSSATIALGFAGYFRELLLLPDAVVITLLIAALAGVAAWGISESVTAAAVITVIEAGGLIAISAAGFWNGDGFDRMTAGLADASLASVPGVLGGALLAFFAFIGFEDIVNVAEETRDPVRVLPRAIILTLVLTTGFYLLILTASLSVATPQSLESSAAPLAHVFEKATGLSPVPVSLVAALAMLNGILIQIIMASRILYGLAAQGRIPHAIGKVHGRTGTPVRATLLVAAIIVVLGLAFPIVTLAKSTSSIILLIFTAVNFALLSMKMRDRTTVPGFSVPVWVPLLGFLASASFLLLQLLQFTGFAFNGLAASLQLMLPG